MRQSLRKSKEPIRVLVVTPDNMTSELLKSAFAHRRRDFIVETLTGSSRKIINELGPLKIDVALICDELQDGPLAGAKVLQKLRRSAHQTRTIMLLQSSNPESIVEAFRDGARGVFHRAHSLRALSKCIETVHRGQIWARNEDLEHIMNVLAHLKPLHFSNVNGKPILTVREENVVQLVAEGLKNREIAQVLKVKEHSVRNYLFGIFEKLGVSNRVELILYAFSERDRSN